MNPSSNSKGMDWFTTLSQDLYFETGRSELPVTALYDRMFPDQLREFLSCKVNAKIPQDVAVHLESINPPEGARKSIHAHFKNDTILNLNGEWEGGVSFELPPCVLKFLENHGFTLPKD